MFKKSKKKNDILAKNNLCSDTVKKQYCFLRNILYSDEGLNGLKDKPYLRPLNPGMFAVCVLQARVSFRILPLPV